MRTSKKTLALASTILLFCNKAAAQGGIKVNSLTDLESKTKEGVDSIVNMTKYAIGGVLGVALVFVIYAIASNQPHAKEYAIGWVIAVAFYLVAMLAI